MPVSTSKTVLLETQKYFNKISSVSTDIKDKESVFKFSEGIRDLGLWDSTVCWPLRSLQNAGAGSVAYSLGGLGIYNGTLVNNPTWGSEGINFNGSNTYIQNSDLSDNAEGTIAAFAFTNNAIVTGEGHRLVQMGTGLLPGIEIGATNSFPNVGIEAYYTQLASEGVGRNVSPPTSIVGVRFGAFGVFSNAQSITRYINKGSTISNLSVTGNYQSAQGIRIGARVNNSLFWNGSISFAMYSSTKFSDNNVLDFYNLYKSTLGKGLGLP
jgi:hypothetical protein